MGSSTEIQAAPAVTGPTSVLVPSTIGSMLVDQIKAITDKAEEVSVVVNADNFPRAVEVIARLRQAGRELETEFDRLTEPAKKAMKPLVDERKDIKDRIERLNSALEKGILDTYALAEKAGAEEALKMEGVLGSKLTIAKKITHAHKLQVSDESVRGDVVREAVALMLGVPAAALKPLDGWVDTAKIEQMAEAANDGRVPGFALTAFTKRYLQTRAKELVA